jgi:thiol-disulfide isomerase/thioredoxin
VAPLEVGASVPAVARFDADAGPRAVAFYKVTCPVCQMAAPKLAVLHQAYPGHVSAIGQDPDPKLDEFDRQFHLGIPSTPDLPPYPLSNAFDVRVVPTTFLLDDDRVVDVVESWDRDGLNRLSRRLADMVGATPRDVSDATDGLPAFRPG